MSSGRSWPYWVFIALLVILYFTLQLGLGLGREVPDLLTVAVLLGARRFGGIGSAALGFVLGLLRDSLSLTSFGADAVTLTVLGFLGSRSRDYFVGESLAFIAVYLFVGLWLHEVIHLLLAGQAIRGSVWSQLFVQAPLMSLYAAAVGIVALLLYRLVTGDR